MLFVLGNASGRLKLSTFPSVLMQGQTLQLTCLVPRNLANRQLSMGIVDSVYSSRQLGEPDDRVQWVLTLPHAQCDWRMAFCAVMRQDNQQSVVQARVLVGGCEGP